MIDPTDPVTWMREQVHRMPKPDCQIARCDAWKPAQWPGRKFWFVISDFGNGYLVMRLFETRKAQQFWTNRVRRWNAGQIQSRGTIKWKEER